MVKNMKAFVWNIIFILKSMHQRLFAKNYTKKIVKNVEFLNDCKGRAANEKVYYVIRRQGAAGFFSNYLFVLGHCVIAEENGWIPVVDMKNYKTPYNEKEQINGTKNAWEYYFNPYCKIPLDEILKDKCVYLSTFDYPVEKVPYYSLGVGRYPDRKMVKKLQPFIDKYCSIRDDIKIMFDQEAEKYEWSQCIGVHVRGTDMKMASAHPRPLSLQKIIKKIDFVMEKTSNKYHIFLCTDEIRVEEEMRKRYGERLVLLDAYRSADGKQGIHKEKDRDDIRENHHYLLGLEVLRDAYFLSKCSILIAGKSNVPYAAILMNGNKYQKIID